MISDPWYKPRVAEVGEGNFRANLTRERQIVFSGGLNAEALVAVPQPRDEGQRQQNHPAFADHLAGQEIEAAKGQVEKNCAGVHRRSKPGRQHAYRP